METLEATNNLIASIEAELDTYKGDDFEWGSRTHRYIDHLEGRLEELYRHKNSFEQNNQ